MNRKEYLEKRNGLLTEAEALLNSEDVEGYKAKEQEVKDLDEKFDAISIAQANMNALKNEVTPGIKIDGTVENKIQTVEDIHNTIEYRKDFMNFCKTGKADFQNSDAYTSTSDAGAVIPTTIVDEIIKTMKSYGQIYNRVRKINIKGGVNFPILSLIPTASWITEGAVSDKQKVTANTNVSFSYFGLECKVAISLLADITTLNSFENTIVTLITEAMVKAMDVAIIKGAGTTQPLGITADPRCTNIVTLSAVNFVKWDGWKKKVFAKIPLAYRAGGSFIMASGTFEGYIDGMVDANGQPMGRTNYGITNGPQERFGGREVILVEDDVIAPYESASTDDIVAVFCKLSDYAINSNMQMKMFRWFDHDTNQYVDKAILVADGKILDPNGVVIIKKGA